MSYTDHIYDTIVITGIATWEQFIEHRPHLVELVSTCTGPKYVRKGVSWDKHRYWAWTCGACGKSGITRADVLKRWAISNHKCECKRRAKTYECVDASKRCPACGQEKPATKGYWYISKCGYLSHRCKECSKQCRKDRYNKRG